MSHRKAKKIRKALFDKGIPTTTGKYYKDTKTGMVYANQERRIYKQLKKRTLKEALEIVGKLKKAGHPKEAFRA